MITAILVGLSNAAFASAVIAALGIGIVAYLVGDLLILPRTNNMMATIEMWDWWLLRDHEPVQKQRA